MSTHLKEFGERVKFYRELMGMSQQELANLLGYSSRSAITKIEKGERDLPIDKLKLISRVLNTRPEVLIGWVEPSNMNKPIKPKEKTLTVEQEKELDEIMNINKGVLLGKQKTLSEKNENSLKETFTSIILDN